MEGEREGKRKGDKKEGGEGDGKVWGWAGLLLTAKLPPYSQASFIPTIPEPSFPPVSMVPNPAIHMHTHTGTHCLSFITSPLL